MRKATRFIFSAWLSKTLRHTRCVYILKFAKSKSWLVVDIRLITYVSIKCAKITVTIKPHYLRLQNVSMWIMTMPPKTPLSTSVVWLTSIKLNKGSSSSYPQLTNCCSKAGLTPGAGGWETVDRCVLLVFETHLNWTLPHHQWHKGSSMPVQHYASCPKKSNKGKT